MPNRPGRPSGGPSLAERAAEYKLLRERGLTYDEAAEEMGVSRQSIRWYARHLRETGNLPPVPPAIRSAQQQHVQARQTRTKDYAILRGAGLSPEDALVRVGLKAARENVRRYEYAFHHQGARLPERETPRPPSRYRTAVLDHLRRWPASLFSAHDLARVLGFSDNRLASTALDQLAAQGVVEVVDGMRYPGDRKVPARRYRLAPAVQDKAARDD